MAADVLLADPGRGGASSSGAAMDLTARCRLHTIAQ